MHNPEAFFDVLDVVSGLQLSLGGVSRLELQRTTYLACLVALYDGRPVVDWGYRFTRTEFGTPFSAEINDAIETLCASGHCSGEARLLLSESGQSMLDLLKPMENFRQRSKYLTAARGSTLIVPPSTLYDGLDNEPTMRRALANEAGSGLLVGPALRMLYEQFSMLEEAVERNEGDLLTPSVVWLNYLAEKTSTSKGEAFNES